MSRLVVFGDSWPYGAELKAGEKTFGELLHEKLGTDSFVNCSQEGTSIDHLVVQLEQYMSQADVGTDIAVFFISNPIRYMIHKKGNWDTIRPTGDKSMNTRFYYEYLQSDELDNHRANTCILALQNMCRYSTTIVKDIYLEGWSAIDWSYPSINKQKFLPKSALQMFEANMNKQTNELVKNQRNPFIYPNKYHPNQKGHTLIAEELYKFVK
tara:strand:- start:19957 stop:20589 length:633 start_codon:yes stop_codon:yes gene_type:complete